MAKKSSAVKGTKIAKRQAVKQMHDTRSSRDWDLDFKINHHYNLSGQQLEFLEDAQSNNDTHMCIVDGPAGTAKTYIAVLAALNLLKEHSVEEIVYIRSIVESASRQLGSLPGEVEAKFAPWSMPLVDKLDELLPPGVSNNLFAKDYVRCVPVNFTRGLTFRNSCVVIDEAQNLTLSELTTIMTRFGNNTKYIIVGDTLQSDINGKSGFSKILNAFDSIECAGEGINVYRFDKNDIVRSKILRFIVSRLETIE